MKPNWLTRFRCFYLGITPVEMKQIDCSHPNDKVEWIYVEPVTLLPKEGRCKLCNKYVKAKITWS